MTSGSGFGRGGRGAALLKLLEQPVRRPGQQASPTDESDNVPQVCYGHVLHVFVCELSPPVPSLLPLCIPILLQRVLMLAEDSPVLRYQETAI